MGKAPQKKGKHNHGSKKPKESVYLSKAQCLHRLQVTQTDFRRLCVLKGIYPQLPENVKGLQSGKMYFFSKDIKFLMHEPVLEKFRELKSFIKRLKSAREKDEKQHENALMKYVKPNLTYDHLIKERYPTFFSALEDLDDCLTLLFMLSKLPPQDDLQRIEIENASRLCKEFTTYVTKEKCLTKVFLTVKGIYYQAMILGVKITWLVPYDFPQIVPMQVDFKVFKTFLSLYDTLLTFVNFKLFHMMGQKYPPKHQEKHETTIESYILNLPEPEREKEELTEKQKEIQKESEKRIESLNSKITKIVKNQKETNEKEEENEPIVEESDEEDEKVKETTIEPFKQTDKKDIFKSLTFFISRECPKASLEFVIKSQGGHVSFDEKDEKITHHVLDRPTIKNKLLREYIQPQWVYDCVNNQILLPVHKYEPGSTLPPHLSPFVDYEDENQYVPEYQEELSILKKETAALKEVEEGIEEETDEEEMEEIYQRELEAEKKGKKAEEFQEELKEEKIEKIKEKVRNPKKMSKKQEKEDEEKKLKLTMMSNRARNLKKNKKNKSIFRTNQIRRFFQFDKPKTQTELKAQKMKSNSKSGHPFISFNFGSKLTKCIFQNDNKKVEVLEDVSIFDENLQVKKDLFSVLANLKEKSEKMLNQTVYHSTCTVPSFLNESERNSIKQLGMNSKLQMIELLDISKAAVFSSVSVKDEKNFIFINRDQSILEFSLFSVEKDSNELKLIDFAYEILNFETLSSENFKQNLEKMNKISQVHVEKILVADENLEKEIKEHDEIIKKYLKNYQVLVEKNLLIQATLNRSLQLSGEISLNNFDLKIEKTEIFNRDNYFDLNQNIYSKYFTLHKNENVPQNFYFLVDVSNVTKIEMNEKIFIEDIKKIIDFNFAKFLSYQYSKIETKNNSFLCLILMENAFISIEQNDKKVSICIKVSDIEINAYNILSMLTNYFGSEDYQVKQIIHDEANENFYHFQKHDLMTRDHEYKVVIHDTKLLDWKQTPFQKMLIIQTPDMGNGLVLDGLIQYYESMENYTNFFVSKVDFYKPKRILIIGGGDLIILKYMSKLSHWKDIEKITLVDIDGDVIEYARKYFLTHMNDAINDKEKVEIIVGDGNKFVMEHKEDDKYDLIIMDSTDPSVSVSLSLFQRDYFEKMQKIMKDDGVALLQFDTVEAFDEDPPFEGLFDITSEVVYTPEYTGHTLFYILDQLKK